MLRKRISMVTAACAMLLLILDSKHFMLSASEGVMLCIRTVIPALFPFFVLSGYLTGALANTTLLRPLSRLFRLAQSCGPVLVSTILGGYPVGAQITAAEVRQGRISRQLGNHMLYFCSQAGPSFLFGMAAAQFPGNHYGWLLWAVQLLSALSVARILPIQDAQETHCPVASPITLSAAMKQAISATAAVCGWVVLFRGILGFLRRWLFWRFPLPAQVLISGMLELTNGILLLGSVESLFLRLLLAVLFLNFGGICVLMQTMSVCEGLDIRCYIKGKCLQTLFALLYLSLFMGKFYAILPLAAIFLAGNPGKNSSFPAAVGV